MLTFIAHASCNEYLIEPVSAIFGKVIESVGYYELSEASSQARNAFELQHQMGITIKRITSQDSTTTGHARMRDLLPTSYYTYIEVVMVVVLPEPNFRFQVRLILSKFTRFVSDSNR